MTPVPPPEWSWIAAVANHLWQSTLCVAVAAVLARALRQNAARWRYRVWLAASLKFLIPCSLLMAAGSRLPSPVFSSAPVPTVSVVAHVVGEPFAPSGAHAVSSTAQDPQGEVSKSIAGALPRATLAIWAAGCLLLLGTRAVRWGRLRHDLRSAAATDMGRAQHALDRMREQLSVRPSVALVASGTSLEPAVVGIRRPAILWPAGLSNRLTDRELDAIFAHELAHIQRRDNLASSLHRTIALVFWFFPLVWWLESRLLCERERACDEAVLQLGHEPATYARSILKVSSFCLQWPVAAVAGVTGTNLTKRVEDIMSHRTGSTLGVGRRALLLLSAIGLVMGPVAIGSVQAADGSIASALEAARPSGLGLLVAPATPGAAVAQTATGRVMGVVTDPRGAPIAGARITVVGQGTGVSATLTTDESGRYSMELPPAQYELRWEKPGFQSSRETLFVTRGDETRRDVQLRLGRVQETLNIVPPPSQNPPSRTAGDYLELAKTYYQQGLFAQADRMISAAADALRAESASRAATAAAAQAGPVAAGPGPVRVGGEIREPKKIHDVKPMYPQEALSNHVEGIVILEATIGQDGSVIDAKVLRGQPLLNQAALDAVLQWKFMPTLLNGAPVDVMMTVTVNFTLQ